MTDFQQYCLRWNNHQTNLLSVFEELLNNASFTDVTLANDTGLTVKCHKIVLAASSTYFQNLFRELPSQQHPVIVLKDVRYPEMKAILDYMYRGEVSVAQHQLADLLKIAQVLKVKGLIEERNQDSTACNFRREDTTETTSRSPPPAISTSTGGSGGSHTSPPHSTGGYSFYGKSGVPLDRVQSHLASSLPITWSLPVHSAAGHQLPTSLSSSVLGGGSYDNGIEVSPLKRQKLSHSSTLLMNSDTPILRTVLGQTHVDSSQAMSLLQPDSHEAVQYRNASSNGSANDSDNRRNNDLAHGPSDPVYAYVDEDEKQPSSQTYSGDTVKNSAVADGAQAREWKRYKQYTRDDISQAIEAVKGGMSAVQAAKQYGVPSRTLYDKVKKLGIPTSRPFKTGSKYGVSSRSASNGGSGACFPIGIGANVNGALYSRSSVLSENENESSNVNAVEDLASTSATTFDSTYAKVTKDTSQDRDSMSDLIGRCSVSPVIRCAKQRQQQQQQQDLDDQVEDLSVSRKSDVPVIVPPSTTSVVIKDEAQEAGLDNSDCCDYS